ncbi:hypothetical protein GF362_03655 [Candidatus Dojkabacteria bacterium]|nr:hypothetical protein [Candidatus Dojkabacteria bacterium]
MTQKKSGQSFVIILLIIVILLLLCICCSIFFFIFFGSSDRLPDELQNEFDRQDWSWVEDSYTRTPVPPEVEPTIEPLNPPPPQVVETPTNQAEDAIIVDPDASKDFTALETVYQHIMNNLHEQYGDSVQIGSPVKSSGKIEITFTADGTNYTYWIVEKENTGSYAEVVVGPPNAGGILYKLESTGAVWAITEEIDEGI